MSVETSALVRALLKDSLVVWRISGHVTPGEPPANAIIHAASGTVVSVEHAQAADAAIRWWVRWHALGSAPRSQACTSTVGLLRAVRDALGVEHGQRLRIAPDSHRT